jgi:hypothetical protein
MSMCVRIHTVNVSYVTALYVAKRHATNVEFESLADVFPKTRRAECDSILIANNSGRNIRFAWHHSQVVSS